MRQASPALDVVARRLIRASEESLLRWMNVRQIDNDLLGALYLRVREVLDRETWDEQMVEDVTLTIYLTASAWQSPDETPLEFLSSLHEVIAKTLSGNAPMSGARRMQ
jgi:hypothetical protein